MNKKILIGGLAGFAVLLSIIVLSIPKKSKQPTISSYSSYSSTSSSSTSSKQSSSSKDSDKKNSSGISDDLQAALAVYAEKKVKAHLISPSTAKFPLYSKYTYRNEGNVYTITGYVDAKNAYGTELRKSWSVMVEFDGTYSMLICVVIDGETYFD